MMMCSRHALYRMRPLVTRTATRSLASEANASSSSSSSSSSSRQNSKHTQERAMIYLGALLGIAMGGAGISLLEAPPPPPDVGAADAVVSKKQSPTTTTITTTTMPQRSSFQRPGISEEDPNTPPPRLDLPLIALEDVAEHCDESSLWYTFRGAVYDLTFFINGHPGGTPRLLMAAGQDLEPYWEVYRQHLRGHVLDWMEKYRIGNLSPEDTTQSRNFMHGDMFEDDPYRDPDLLPCTKKPFCGEPRIELLTQDYYTPNELFYVRNHLAVPEVDPEEYVLIVKGKGLKKHKFTLEDLKTKFKKYEVSTTLQCAGNRREDMHDGNHKIYIAPHWVVGAMSCAKWGGVRMRDVLKHCGLDVDGLSTGEWNPKDIQHVQFEGYDFDETGMCYGGSIPIDKAVDPLGDALFAFEMNGDPLPRDHGYPVRAIAPGHAGARQCKWLHKVIVSEKESQKSWQQKSYLAHMTSYDKTPIHLLSHTLSSLSCSSCCCLDRGFAPNINFEEDLSHWPPARLDQAPIVQEMPVQSLVCNPPQNAILGGKNATDITLKGVAWSGGGRKIERVDVSIDGGKTWRAAELYKPIEQRRNRHWAWTQFTQTIPLPQDIQDRLKRGEQVQLDVASKAMNSDFNVQPERMEPYWNARGVCVNHWYHVNVTMDPNKEKSYLRHDHTPQQFGNTPSGGTFPKEWGEHGWTSDPKHDDGANFKLKKGGDTYHLEQKT